MSTMSWPRPSMAPPVGADTVTRAGGIITERISGRVAKIGAGCGPRCRNRALTKIVIVAAVAITMATVSRGWLAIATANLPPSLRRTSTSASFFFLLVLRLGNLLHL
jgi:hypothetical protein